MQTELPQELLSIRDEIVKFAKKHRKEFENLPGKTFLLKKFITYLKMLFCLESIDFLGVRRRL